MSKLFRHYQGSFEEEEEKVKKSNYEYIGYKEINRKIKYAYTDSEWVRSFLRTHTIKPLSIREASKHITWNTTPDGMKFERE